MAIKDQKWILKQLKPEQQSTFQQHQGYFLLNQAQRFGRIFSSRKSMNVTFEAEPALYATLNSYEPLFIAIILEQGRFSWQDHFLQTSEHSQQITQLMNAEVLALKPSTKSCLFRQWQANLNFQEQLEYPNG